MDYTEFHKVHEMMVTTTKGVYPASQIPKQRLKDTQEETEAEQEWKEPKHCPFKRGVNDTCNEDCAWSAEGACVVTRPCASVNGVGKRCPVKSGTKCEDSCAMYVDGCALTRCVEV